MHALNLLATGGEAVGDLEEAARIPSSKDGRASFRDVIQLSLEELVGHFGLDEVVDAGAAAAPGAFGQFDEL